MNPLWGSGLERIEPTRPAGCDHVDAVYAVGLSPRQSILGGRKNNVSPSIRHSFKYQSCANMSP
jgi:hypothetical protein